MKIPPACPRPVAARPPRDWTILLYMNGQNDLERGVIRGFLGAQSVGSSPQVAVLADLARLPQPRLQQLAAAGDGYYAKDNIDGDWSGVRRYVVERNRPDNHDPQIPVSQDLTVPSTIHSTLVAADEAARMTNPAELQDFVAWGLREYPAKHVMLVMMGHGDGPIGAMTEDTQPKSTMMSSDSIAGAVRGAENDTGVKIDVVHMAACLEQSAEFAYEMKDATHFLVASEEVGYSSMFDYAPVLQMISKSSSMEPEQLGHALVDYYRNTNGPFTHQSLVDVTQMGALADAVDALGKAILAPSLNPSLLRQAVERSQAYRMDDARHGPEHDLYSLADALSSIADPALQQACDKVKQAVGKVVLDEFHKNWQIIVPDQSKDRFHEESGPYDSHGLSIAGESPNPRWRQWYDRLAFSRDVVWKAVLDKLAA